MSGTWYILPTPFAEDGALDHASLRRLVEAAIDWGVDGLAAMGVMAEPTTLTAEERETALRTIFDAAAGRAPVIVGCSSTSQGQSSLLIARARELGAMAAMVAAPPLLRNVDLLPGFFAGLAKAGLPVVIQDEPAATGVLVPVSVLVDCAEASGSNTVKLEDPPTPPKIARLLERRPGLSVFGGLGGVAALSELRRGACGTMTGFAYPEILRAVRVALTAGQDRAAAILFDRYLPLIQFEAQPVIGLAVRKEVLRRRGAIASNLTRGLVPRLDRATAAELTDVLDRLGMVPGLARFEP